ncbi:MAG: aminotransferase class IV [Acidobacteriota bacterium]|nr:aminotransferase class IV [Acidobacteriota bacterium]
MDDYALCGYSLFETFSARQGCFWRLEDHYKRLAASAAVFSMEMPSEQVFREEIASAHDSRIDQVLRYTLIRAGGRWSDQPAECRRKILTKPLSGRAPEALDLCMAQQPLACLDELRRHKSGSRIYYQAQFDRARKADCHDCVFIDLEGRLLETSSYNLYFLMNGQWLTPPLRLGLLPGVFRGYLLQQRLVREREVHLSQLPEVSAVIVSNSVQGLRPVRRLGDHSIRTEPAANLLRIANHRVYRPLFS